MEDKQNRQLTMKEYPEDMQPYEKCLSQGEAALSNAELLAVILRCGIRGRPALALAGDVLEHCRYRNGLAGLLHMSLQELMEIEGIGRVKAVQLKCIGELSGRIQRESAKRELSFREPSTIADYYMETLRHREQESVYCLMLDNGNSLIGECELTRGTVNAAQISPREILIKAVSFHAVNLVLLHNHPSGDPSPSEADRVVTRRIAEALSLAGICLLDHIIIGDRTYYSMVSEGDLSFPQTAS